MSTVSIYLNFDRQAEAAFNFYKSVFETQLEGIGFLRFGDVPPIEGEPPMDEAAKKLIRHCSLPTLGGIRIMGTDVLLNGAKVISGNQSYINLEPDTKKETDTLFAKLSAGGKAITPLQDNDYGYLGTCVDKYGVQWMFFCKEKKE